jgi:hypothetical protein
MRHPVIAIAIGVTASALFVPSPEAPLFICLVLAGGVLARGDLTRFGLLAMALAATALLLLHDTSTAFICLALGTGALALRFRARLKSSLSELFDDDEDWSR